MDDVFVASLLKNVSLNERRLILCTRECTRPYILLPGLKHLKEPMVSDEWLILYLIMLNFFHWNI